MLAHPFIFQRNPPRICTAHYHPVASAGRERERKQAREQGRRLCPQAVEFFVNNAGNCFVSESLDSLSSQHNSAGKAVQSPRQSAILERGRGCKGPPMLPDNLSNIWTNRWSHMILSIKAYSNPTASSSQISPLERGRHLRDREHLSVLLHPRRVTKPTQPSSICFWRGSAAHSHVT